MFFSLFLLFIYSFHAIHFPLFYYINFVLLIKCHIHIVFVNFILISRMEMMIMTVREEEEEERIRTIKVTVTMIVMK